MAEDSLSAAEELLRLVSHQQAVIDEMEDRIAQMEERLRMFQQKYGEET